MIEVNRSLILMQESFDSMYRSGTIQNEVVVSLNTVILGSDESLDSLGFVTFISDMEERISDEAGKECYIVLSEIQGLDANNSYLTTGALAQYIRKITEET
jgi:hypothetical protein